MKQSKQKIVIYYNLFTILFLLVGIIYIYLGEVSMGFSRDIVYREYLIKENIFTLVKKEYFIFLWLLPFFYFSYKTIKDRSYSFSRIVNILTFLLIFVFFYFFISENTMLLALFNIFALIRVSFSNRF